MTPGQLEKGNDLKKAITEVKKNLAEVDRWESTRKEISVNGVAFRLKLEHAQTIRNIIKTMAESNLNELEKQFEEL